MTFNIGQRVTRRVPGPDLEELQAIDSEPLDLLKAGHFDVTEEHDFFVRAAVFAHAALRVT